MAYVDTDQDTAPGEWHRYASIAPELRRGVHAYPLAPLGWTFLEEDAYGLRLF